MPMTKITALAVALACAAPHIAAAETTRLLVNCLWPAQHFMCKSVLPAWKDKVEAATEGRVRISFPASSMAPPPEQMDAVRNGIFDAGMQMNAFVANEIVGPRVSLTPFSTTSDSRANSVALWRTYETYLASEDEYDGVTLLGLFAAPGGDFYSTTDTPITSLASALDRKMWALPGVTSAILKDNGGNVVAGPAVQMTELIQHGVVDGFVGLPASDAVAFNVAPYAKSVTRTGRKVFAAGFSFVVNDAKWAEITPADQEAVLAVSGEAFAELAGEAWSDIEAGVMEEMKGSMDVIEASPESEAELETTAEPLTAEWVAEADAKGIDGQAALDFFRETVTELTR